MPIIGIVELVTIGKTECDVCGKCLGEEFLAIIPDIHAADKITILFQHTGCSPQAVNATAEFREKENPQ